MPFISSVTRRKEDAGVTLRAKIVTPKHHLSATKQYKVRIKANTMSDYDCCVADNAFVVAKINNRNDLEEITQSLEGMDLYGNNDTSHSYSLENANTNERITSYLANDGQVISRPLYGTEDKVQGFLVVKTSKNKESVTSKIPIAMAAYSANEVFDNSNLYNISVLWNTIKGENDSAALNGMNNVHKDLNLTNKIDLSSMCTPEGLSKIQCTYDIRDELAEDSAYSIDTNRINSLGVVSRMTYEDAAQLFINTYGNKATYNSTAAQNRWIDKIEGTYEGNPVTGTAFINKVQRILKGARIAFRVGKISVKAHFVAEGADYYSQELPLQIVSEYLTYNQVKDAIINSCKLYFFSNIDSDSKTLYTLEQKSSNEVTTLNTITAIASDAAGSPKKGKILVYSQQGTDNAIVNDALNRLALSSSNDDGFGGLSGISMNMYIRKVNSLDIPYDFASNSGKFESQPNYNDNMTGSNETTQFVYLCYDKFIEETNIEKNKFAILGQLSINAGTYSSTGQSIGDSSMTETINLVQGFQVIAPS